MKKIKLGMFGLGRGSDFFKLVTMCGGEVTAICDNNPQSLENASAALDGKAAAFSDFDRFIEYENMDAVMLVNCFHEHAPFAIRALEKGLHVLTECTSNGTMAEGVALVRAVEKANTVYMLAENYQYAHYLQEMRTVFRSGSLGKLLYAEGEYNHPINWGKDVSLNPYAKHWRNYLPRTYYITHSLAPLMYITGAVPTRVTALPVFAPLDDDFPMNGHYVGDRAAIITTINDDDSVFKVTGCAAFGAEENSYRICGTKGQIENPRGSNCHLSERYNPWDVPEGGKEKDLRPPRWPEEYKEQVKEAGHGGCDFFVIKEFFDCIREGRQPELDVYCGTTMASVAILGHRSLLEYGVPYDIPDFRREEDRVKYENDTLTPFWGTDGTPPSIPCCSKPDYAPDPEKYRNYLRATGELEE